MAPEGNMARGKHGARKLNRDAERLARQLEEARADLASEQRRLRAADAEVARVDGLRQQLTQALNERDSAVAGEVTRLQREVEVLTTLTQEATVFDERTSREWNQASGVVVERLGGGIEGFENLMKIAFSGGGSIIDAPGLQRIGRVGAQRVQKAQGRRRLVSATGSAGRHKTRYLTGSLRRRYQRVFAELLGTEDPEPNAELPDTASDSDRARVADVDHRLDRLERSRATDVNADAVHAWHPMMWIDDVPADTNPVLTMLGAVHPDADTVAPLDLPENVRQPTADLLATQRAALAASDPEQLMLGWEQPLQRSAAITETTGRSPSASPYDERLSHLAFRWPLEPCAVPASPQSPLPLL
jgi:hypothetical protein